MAQDRVRVSHSRFTNAKMLCIEAVGFTQGGDPKKRASVDVRAETTRFEVVLRDEKGVLLERLVGSAEEWLTHSEATRYAQGFLKGLRHA